MLKLSDMRLRFPPIFPPLTSQAEIDADEAASQTRRIVVKLVRLVAVFVATVAAFMIFHLLMKAV